MLVRHERRMLCLRLSADAGAEGWAHAPIAEDSEKDEMRVGTVRRAALVGAFATCAYRLDRATPASPDCHGGDELVQILAPQALDSFWFGEC
jgi:hypothetical protein